MNSIVTQYSVVSDVAEALNWKIQTSNQMGDWDIYWTDFSIQPDVLIRMHLFQKINHYPGIHAIARKNLLGLNLMTMRTQFPEEYNFFPLTWMLPHQYVDFRNYYETKQKGKTRTYIVKPQDNCQGRGIFLTRKLEDLQNGKHYVVQRYVARPYLLEGLKFDFRIYVLLCGTNPLRLYLYKQGLARFATQLYNQPTNSNLEKQYIHLTNYAINKYNPKFVFNNNSSNMGYGHKRSLTTIFKQLEAKNINIQSLKNQIKDICIKTLISGLPLMSHQYRCSQPQDYTGNMCFHVLGLDVLINNKQQPLLIQVNHTPSFATDTPLDYKIKYNLIKDSLILMNINVKKKNQLIIRSKEVNKERLLTGKRQIYEGIERQLLIDQAQKIRNQFEDQHLGDFERIFPIDDNAEKMQRYNAMIDYAFKAYLSENCPIKLKLQQKQAKKMEMQKYKKNKVVQQTKQQSLKEHQETMGAQTNDSNGFNQIGNTTLKSIPSMTNKLESSILFKQQERKIHQISGKISSKCKNSLIKERQVQKPKNNNIRINKATTPHRQLSVRKQYQKKQIIVKKTMNQPMTVLKNHKPNIIGHKLYKNPDLFPNIQDNQSSTIPQVCNKNLVSPNKSEKSRNHNKIMDNIAFNMQNLVTEKNCSAFNNGQYVMPRIFCLNFIEQKQNQQQLQELILKKGISAPQQT